MSELKLTQDQQNAYLAFNKFIADPDDKVFVLSGYAGTGKSTLVKKLLADLPKFYKTLKLIDHKFVEPDTILTATTNKAAENLASIVNEPVSTIHSVLGLTVLTDYKTNKSTLVRNGRKKDLSNHLIFIDEASYIDHKLLGHIKDGCALCKVVFIGDPAQLLAVNAKSSPVFGAGYTEASLKEIVRQADDNPIQNLCNNFRETVIQGKFFPVNVDGNNIKHLPRDDFEQAIAGEFLRSDWKYGDSKVLAWTNKSVIAYNHAIRSHVAGEPELEVGDYAICNKFFKSGKKESIKTDQQVRITDKYYATRHGVDGWMIQVDNKHTGFLPASRQDAKVALEKARAAEEWGKVAAIDNWFDLRAAYACTINKSQGSTYNKVFIDLDDIGKCRQQDYLARMLYVGASRARNQIVLTGDIA
jgi:hypothetical protein